MSEQRDNEQTLRQWARDFSTDEDREVFISCADEIAILRAQLFAAQQDLLTEGMAADELRSHLASARKAAIEECKKIAEDMTHKHASPTGDAYTCGVWDQGIRIIGKMQLLLTDELRGNDD